MRNHGFPLVAEFILPPNRFTASAGDHRRLQVAVFGGVPLFRKIWIERREVIDARGNRLPRADRTAVVLMDPRADTALVFMSVRTAPPRLSRSRHHPIRRYAVFLAVPFFGDFGVFRLQIVKPGQQLFIGAKRTAASADAGGDFCLPFMAEFILPPHGAVALRRHHIWL